MVFQQIHNTGGENAKYGQRPRGGTGPIRTNAINIRSWQTYAPLKTDDRTNINTTYQRLDTTGLTLEVGVTIKHKGSPGSYQVNIATYNSDTEVGTTGGSGYQLEGGEEVFIAVRNLRDVWVKESSGAAINEGELVYYAR